MQNKTLCYEKAYLNIFNTKKRLEVKEAPYITRALITIKVEWLN